MKIGIKSFYLDRYGVDDGLAKMSRHGYECLDYSMVDTDKGFYLLDGNELINAVGDFSKKVKNNKLEISQTHGPWRFPPKDGTEADRTERFEKMSKALYITSLLGCKYMVVHPLLPFGFQADPEPKVTFDINVDFFKRLSEVAEKYGVIICLENLPFHAFSLSLPKDVLRLTKAINSDFVRVCLDTGHNAVMGGNAGEAARLLGKEYLRVMHVHDNDGKGDLHNIPFSGVVDWEDFSKALREIGFDAAMSLETHVKGDPTTDGFEEKELELVKIALKIAGR